MRLDHALKEAFARDLGAVPERRPDAAEVSRALERLSPAVRGPGPVAAPRRLGFGDVLPVLAMVAATIAVARLDVGALNPVRPLADKLAVGLPDEAGSRFIDFVLVAGESYRSVD